MTPFNVKELADTLVLGALLNRVKERHGGFELLAHWKQGEFHHDVVLQLDGLGVLVVSTNCNGGIKEVLTFDSVPERYALWHARCPDNDEFAGTLPPVRSRARTHHWFDPCELLRLDARSELRPEHRRRQLGGGWEPVD